MNDNLVNLCSLGVGILAITGAILFLATKSNLSPGDCVVVTAWNDTWTQRGTLVSHVGVNYLVNIKNGDLRKYQAGKHTLIGCDLLETIPEPEESIYD